MGEDEGEFVVQLGLINKEKMVPVSGLEPPTY